MSREALDPEIMQRFGVSAANLVSDKDNHQPAQAQIK